MSYHCLMTIIRLFRNKVDILVYDLISKYSGTTKILTVRNISKHLKYGIKHIESTVEHFKKLGMVVDFWIRELEDGSTKTMNTLCLDNYNQVNMMLDEIIYILYDDCYEFNFNKVLGD